MLTRASAEGTVSTVVELTPETVYTVEGDYILSDLITDILSDALVKEGWAYYYMEGTETGKPSKNWKKAKGSYTTCEVIFQMTNLKEPQDVPSLNAAAVTFSSTRRILRRNNWPVRIMPPSSRRSPWQTEKRN